MKAGALRKIEAHAFERQPEEHYVEPTWVDRVLFENVDFSGFIHDPCCGWGRIPYAARAAGHVGVTGSDIVDRGFPGVGIENFLTHEPPQPYDNIVMNPPFDLMRSFIERARKVSTGAVASICLTRRLNAASWMLDLGLSEILYLTPRPSMPPGRVAEEIAISLGTDPSGGQQDFCWVVFGANAGGFVRVGWLHRDKGRLRRDQWGD